MSEDEATTLLALVRLVQQQGDLVERLMIDVSALTTYLERRSWFDRADYARVHDATRIALAGLHQTGRIPSVELLIEILKADPGVPS